MPEKSRMRVIIVGGSVAGLSLANMLEKYGIDFVVLEKHEEIAPQLGASIGLLPTGERILDQLGCYEAVESLSSPVNIYSFYDENGNAKHHDSWGTISKTLFGYKTRFLHRQQLVQILYNNLQDKSKVLTSHPVAKIELLSDGVMVETTSGSVFTGSIVVGADGVHSRVAQEMQRFAEKEIPKLRLNPLNDGFECSCRCIFGMSKPSQHVVEDQMMNVSNKNRNYFCAGGTDGQFYWLVFVRNEKPTRGSSIPRYTNADKEILAATLKDDIIKPGLTFGNLYASQTTSTLVPIEEGLLERCFFGRIVLTGDSWHKVHPITGQGGSQAIMSSAYLANELDKLNVAEGPPSNHAFEKAFVDYQTMRGPQAKASIKEAQFLYWTGSLATPFAAFLQGHVIRKISTEAMLVGFAQGATGAVPLKRVSLPSRRGTIPWNHEIALKPEARSAISTAFWVGLLFLTVAIHYHSVENTGPVLSQETDTGAVSQFYQKFVLFGLDGSSTKELHFNMSVTAVVLWMCIESYRLFIPKSLSSVMPFAIAALFVGWEYIIPMYFALYIWTSGVKTFYYPTPRVIERSLGKSMRIAYTFIYLPTIGLSIWKPDFMSTTWAAAHTMFPIVTYGFNQMIARRSSAINRRKPGVFDNEHIGPIKEVLFLNMVVSIGAQFKSRGNFYQYYGRALMGYPLGRDEARIASTDWATILFMFFSLWDLSRVNIAAEGVVEDMAWILASVFMVTPNFILMNSWNAREEQWERARKITGAESKKGVDVGYDSSC